MENLKKALKSLNHIKVVWVDPSDENIWFYKPKMGFKELTRAGVLGEEKPKGKNVAGKVDDKK